MAPSTGFMTIVATALSLNLACSSSKGTQSPTPPGRTTVIVGGSISPSLPTNGQSYAEALYWQDGIPVPLVNDASTVAVVSAMAVAGTDIYALGMDSVFSSGGTLWKNGVASNIVDPAQGPGAVPYTFNAIALSGTDVYLAGTLAISSFNKSALLWKNGVPGALGSGFSATVNSVFVQGVDIYAAGDDGGGAKYWKNGVVYGLGSSSGKAYANAIAVTPAGEILVAGTVLQNGGVQVATLWKNGVPVPLSDGVTPAFASTLAFSGTDIYVAGVYFNNERYAATLWKNGTGTALPCGQAGSQARAICADGQDVYVAGTDGNQAVYWKNGAEVVLTTGQDLSVATSICVLHP